MQSRPNEIMSSNLWIVWERSYRPVCPGRPGRHIINDAWNAKGDNGVSGGALIVRCLALYVAVACDTAIDILLFTALNVGPGIPTGVPRSGRLGSISLSHTMDQMPFAPDWISR